MVREKAPTKGSPGNRIRIEIPIQANKKHCWGCHFNEQVERKTLEPPDVIRFCGAFAKQLEEDKRGAIRLEKCKQAEC